MDDVLTAPLHESLNRPILLAGGERELMLALAVICGVFIVSLAHVWAALLGITIWLIGHYALSRAAAYDPQLSRTGARSMRLRRHYAASATPFTQYREVK